MGRKLHYKPGSFYRLDDRTGFPQRAERTRKQWNGIIVDERVWEPRQPQDLVKGVIDQQAVPEPRPMQPNVFDGPDYYTLSQAASVGATAVYLNATTGLQLGSLIGIMMDSGAFWNAVIVLGQPLQDGSGQPLLDTNGLQIFDAEGAVTSTFCAFLPPLGGSAASGNQMVCYSQDIPNPPLM